MPSKPFERCYEAFLLVLACPLLFGLAQTWISFIAFFYKTCRNFSVNKPHSRSCAETEPHQHNSLLCIQFSLWQRTIWIKRWKETKRNVGCINTPNHPEKDCHWCQRVVFWGKLHSLEYWIYFGIVLHFPDIRIHCSQCDNTMFLDVFWRLIIPMW